MAPPSNKELARKLRILAKSATNEKVKKVLLQAADRLQKPGHPHNDQNAICLYSVWRKKDDKLVCFELPEKECLKIMEIGHAGFMAALRRGSGKWEIHKKFADEDPEDVKR